MFSLILQNFKGSNSQNHKLHDTVMYMLFHWNFHKMDQHIATLNRLYRMCAEFYKGTFYYKYANDTKSCVTFSNAFECIFSVDISRDNQSIHPSCICQDCHSSIAYNSKISSTEGRNAMEGYHGKWKKNIDHNSSNGIVMLLMLNLVKSLTMKFWPVNVNKAELKYPYRPSWIVDTIWVASHTSKCQANHKKITPAMELIGTLDMLQQSEGI